MKFVLREITAFSGQNDPRTGRLAMEVTCKSLRLEISSRAGDESHRLESAVNLANVLRSLMRSLPAGGLAQVRQLLDQPDPLQRDEPLLPRSIHDMGGPA